MKPKRQRMRIAVVREVMDDEPLSIDIRFPIGLSYQEFITTVKDAIDDIIVGVQTEWEKTQDEENLSQ